ncbi:MAG: hypothetical protein HY929_05170 [Euryarchaeota archaeon]|nr:hypothetical protein [Euryarchaeota archaeon]
MSSIPNLSYFLSQINLRIYNGCLRIDNAIEGVLDLNWLEEHKLLYQKIPGAYPYAKRLLLSGQNGQPWGIVNLRAINPVDPIDHRKRHSNISETYLKPPNQMNEGNYNYITCLNTYDAYGQKVKCVPFIMPNPDFGMCAQASVWICLKILEGKSRGAVPSKTIPEIQHLATGYHFSDARGLLFSHIRRLIKMNNCNSFYYNNKLMDLSDDEMVNIIYAYVESGLPVIIGIDVSRVKWWDNHPTGYHSVVLIGHTIDGDTGKVNGFILHDESKYPYLTITSDELLNAWGHKKDSTNSQVIREAVVGVPPVVQVGYENALKWRYLLDSLHLGGLIKTNQFPIRPFLLSYTDVNILFKEFEFSNTNFKKLFYQYFSKIPPKAWMWLLILHVHEKQRLQNEFEGLILSDATENDNLLFLAVEEKIIIYLSSDDNKYYQVILQNGEVKEEVLEIR